MRYFADTWFWVALINPKEPGNAKAKALLRQVGDNVVTSQLVMIEFMAHCSDIGPHLRTRCFKLVESLASGPIKVVPHTEDVYRRALVVYGMVSNDKEWSLVDCASFEVMRDEKITHALTEDGHFTQAGFVIAS